MANKEADNAEDTKPAEDGELPEGEVAAEGGKSKKKLIIIAAGVLVLLIAIGAGAFFMLGHKSQHSEGENAESHGGSNSEAKIEQPVYFDLPQMLVNLNTSGKQTSFIKTTITLEIASKEEVPLVEANLPRLMDSYNSFLREMRSTDLYGSAGMYRLREEMLSRANTVLAPVKVKDVLFREILVQ